MCNPPLSFKRWFRKANIGLLVTSWWGPDRIEDTNTLEVIMEHEHIGNLKIALHYETTGRIKDGKNMTVPRSDIQYMCENYFDHPNYYKIDGRPVVVMYISRKLEKDGILVEALLTMKSEAAKCGQNLFLIGDAVFAKAPDQDEPFISFSYFDAVTNYDVYGSSGKPNPHAGKESVDNYYEEQKKWRDLAIKENCRYIPPVSPGYNDRGVRLDADNPPLSRRLSEFSDEGSLFLYQLQKALPLVDPNVDNMILINSFNEWHEDTQIEPTAIGGFAKTPEALTGGLEYVGYGERYLDILRTQTKNDKKGSTSANIVPSSNVYFTNVHTCSNSHDGVTFYITENDDDNQFNDLGNRDIELVFTPGPDVVSCKNKRFDYELHGGGNLAFNSTSAIIGDTCANGKGASDCSAISISDCDDSNSKCRHRDIITSGGTILKDHEIQ
jgi:glycoprotein endo-alpha-1,2-mannosidase